LNAGSNHTAKRMIRRCFGLALFLMPLIVFSPQVLLADATADTLKTATAVRAAGNINLDGDPTEPDWQNPPEITGFRQFEPNEGEACTQKTVVKILYDDEAIYFGCWCYDSEPDKISAILTRRDRWSQSDFISIRIDSHHDHQTAYYFNVNAAGVQRDILLFDNSNADESWDAVWEANAKVHDWGWTSEFKIPYSALRFVESDSYTWGLQIARYIGRRQEDARWQFTPRSETRGVARYGHLVGLLGIEPPGRVEVMPYLVGTGIYEPETDGNPDGRKAVSDIGLDFKYGLSSAFTLDATINPDFGQVESDETILNLTAYETYYPEKRPFFLEGIDLFRSPYFYQFYSRRIGRAPSGEIDSASFYYDYPRNTGILGAFKLTGKTTGGTAMGILNATTGEEKAEYAIEGDAAHHKGTVEPLANYSVVRIKQDIFNKSYVGGLFTAVNQKDEIDSYSASTDWGLYLPDDRYKWNGTVIGTRNGPGTNGLAFMTEIMKEGGKNIVGNVMMDYYDEKVDWNRLGYIDITGYWGSSTWIQFRSNKEIGVINFANVNFNRWYNEYLDGLRYTSGGNVNFNLRFKDNSWMYGGVSQNDDRYEKRETRGNGHWLMPYGMGYWIGGYTNESKPLSFSMYHENYHSRDGWGNYYEVGPIIRPRANMEFQLFLSYENNQDQLYWVGSGEDDAAVFRRLNQEEFDITLRSIYTFTRNLTLQWYSQLFFSAGKYGDYYRMVDPETLEEVDPSTYSVSLSRNDFNYKALNINLILRWEFRPGSTLYLVWTQARDRYDSGNSGYDYGFRFSRDFDDMFAMPQTNTFLAKVNYWWNI